MTVLPGPSAVETALVASGLVGRAVPVPRLPAARRERRSARSGRSSRAGRGRRSRSSRRSGCRRSLALARGGDPGAAGRGLPRADEAVRGGRARVGRRARARGSRSRRRARSRSSSGRASRGVGRGRPRVAAVAELVAAGVAAAAGGRRRRAAHRRRAQPPLPRALCKSDLTTATRPLLPCRWCCTTDNGGRTRDAPARRSAAVARARSSRAAHGVDAGPSTGRCSTPSSFGERPVRRRPAPRHRHRRAARRRGASRRRRGRSRSPGRSPRQGKTRHDRDGGRLLGHARPPRLDSVSRAATPSPRATAVGDGRPERGRRARGARTSISASGVTADPKGYVDPLSLLPVAAAPPVRPAARPTALTGAGAGCRRRRPARGRRRRRAAVPPAAGRPAPVAGSGAPRRRRVDRHRRPRRASQPPSCTPAAGGLATERSAARLRRSRPSPARHRPSRGDGRAPVPSASAAHRAPARDAPPTRACRRGARATLAGRAVASRRGPTGATLAAEHGCRCRPAAPGLPRSRSASSLAAVLGLRSLLACAARRRFRAAGARQGGLVSLTAMRFYLTTPIYYVNSTPHIGHAYTTIAADILARHHRQRGDETFFLTGTDEHASKVAPGRRRSRGSSRRSTSTGSPSAWRELPRRRRTRRTTSSSARPTRGTRRFVQEFLQRIYDNGDIYEDVYAGLYCVGCEAFKTEAELVDGMCPEHGIAPSASRRRTTSSGSPPTRTGCSRSTTSGPTSCCRGFRYNEARSFIEGGLQDFSISRAGQPWGVPIPWDESQVAYVWVDALINYLSALTLRARRARTCATAFWPEVRHLLGKDILRFHCVFWPALLLAAGYERAAAAVRPRLPAARRPEDLEVARQRDRPARPRRRLRRRRRPLLGAARGRRSARTGASRSTAFTSATSASSANDLGNLVSRTTAMIARYRDGRARRGGPDRASSPPRSTRCARASPSAFDALRPDGRARGRSGSVVRALNRHVEETRPGSSRRTRRRRTSSTRCSTTSPTACARSRSRSRRTCRRRRRGSSTRSASRSTSRWDRVAYGRTRAADGIEPAPPLFPRVDADRAAERDRHARAPRRVRGSRRRRWSRARARPGSSGSSRSARASTRAATALAIAERDDGRLRGARHPPAPGRRRRRRAARRAARAARASERAVAVGETGLDYYRDYAPRDRAARALRAPARARRRARQAGRHPHARRGRRDAPPRSTASRAPSSCTASRRPALLPVALERGYYVSFAGNVTYPKADELRDGRAPVPADRLLAETDCPYLAPAAACAAGRTSPRTSSTRSPRSPRPAARTPRRSSAQIDANADRRVRPAVSRPSTPEEGARPALPRRREHPRRDRPARRARAGRRRARGRPRARRPHRATSPSAWRIVHAVELDRSLEPRRSRAARRARRTSSSVFGDALRLDLAALEPAPTKLVANLPVQHRDAARRREPRRAADASSSGA